MRSVNPGVGRNQVLTRQFLNEQLKTTPKGMNIGAIKDYQVGEEISVKGIIAGHSTVDEIKPYEVAVIYTTAFSDSTQLEEQRKTPVSILPASMGGTYPTWGIAQDYITKTQAGRILLVGHTWLRTSEDYEMDFFPIGNGIDIIDGVVRKVAFGRGTLYSGYRDYSPRVPIILGGPPVPMDYLGVVTGGLPMNTSKDVNICVPSLSDPSGLVVSDKTIKCHTWPTPITNDPATVEIKYINGSYYAMEIC